MSMNITSVFLVEVTATDEQIEILYSHLKEREYSISHGLLPQHEDHVKFVGNHPYRAWFIIKEAEKIIGNAYVQFDNSIGLNCIEEITEAQIENVLYILTNKLKPLEGLPSVRSSEFFLNVPTTNTRLQNKLLRIGLVELQRSFQLVKD